MINLKGLKIQEIAKDKCFPNVKNPRIELITFDIDDTLKDEKTTTGIKKPCVVFDDGSGKFEIGQGHRRWASAMKFEHIKTIPCIVIPKSGLTELDMLEILMDHNEETPLSKAECFKAIKEFFLLSFGDSAIIKRCKMLLNSSFGSPSPEKIKDARKEAVEMHEDADRAEEKVIFEKHHGTIQNFRRLALLPVSVQEEYIKAWQGRNSDLTQKDIKILSEFWNELVKANPETKVSEPPKAFEDKVEELKEINRQPDDKKKSVKRSKSDIENMSKGTENAIVRKTLSWVLGEITDSELKDYVKAKSN
ncbi:MAG TPA: ParB N-terminal domain-containing protein [Candidatus Cloacimonadota bacterium]|nr:ParB N-terminal domain-containing protein [Candidatus Cloacimonadota bacterium]